MGKKKRRNRRKRTSASRASSSSSSTNTSSTRSPVTSTSSPPSSSSTDAKPHTSGGAAPGSPTSSPLERARAECQTGVVQYSLGNHRSAINQFSKAIAALFGSKTPDVAFLVEAFLKRACARLHLKAYAQVMEDCDLALKLDSSNHRALVVRGLAKNCLRGHGEAISDYKRALECDGIGSVLKSALSQLRDDAIAAMQASSPSSEDAGDSTPQAPTQSWSKCAALCDDAVCANLPLADAAEDGVVASASSGPSSHEKLVENTLDEIPIDATNPSASSDAPSPPTRCPALLVPIGEASVSSDILDAVGDGGDDDAYREKEKGNEAFVERDYSKALVHYSRAIELNSRESVFYSNRALVYLRLHRYHEAISDCTASIERNASIKAFARRGMGWAGLGEYLLASTNFKEALQFEPHNQDCLENLQRSLIGLQQEYAEMLTSNPDDALVKRHLYEVEEDIHRTQLVLSTQHVKKKSPHTSSPKKEDGRAPSIEYIFPPSLRTKAEQTMAIKHYSAMIDADGSDAAAYIGRAHALDKHGDTAGAIEDLKRAIAIDPNNKSAVAILHKLQNGEIVV